MNSIFSDIIPISRFVETSYHFSKGSDTITDKFFELGI
jgi:hypothetical protein